MRLERLKRYDARLRKTYQRQLRQNGMSVRKISASRLADYPGPRRARPKLNSLKRQRSALLETERQLLSAICHDDNLRAAFDAGMGREREPLSVWIDSDQSWNHTWVHPRDLPAWEFMSERMKMFVGFDVALEFGWCFAFSVNIASSLVTKWSSENSNLVANVQQRIRRSMVSEGISDLPICWVIETRTRSGKSRTKPHLHGIAICEEPLLATKLKMALESSIAAQKEYKRARRSIHIERGYAKNDLSISKSRWVSYITKNVDLYDQRLGKRRIYMSRSFTQVAKTAWDIRRDPIFWK